MSREVHAVPPAPRHVLWRAVLWHRWPLALAGFLLAVYGGLFGMMLGFAGTGSISRTDQQLAAGVLDGSTRQTDGTVTQVEPSSAQMRGAALDTVHFTFEHETAGTTHGRCFARTGRFRAGDQARVEYDPLHAEISRLEGTRVTLVSLWNLAQSWLLATVGPGLLAILLWLAGVLRLRALLAHGDVAVAEITELRIVRLVIPGMFAVEFGFRDHHAHPRRGQHWVRQRSALGMRLARGPARIAVVHDRRRPARCRIVLPEDFQGTPPTPLPDLAGRPHA